MSTYLPDKIKEVKIAIDSVINQTLAPNQIVIVIDGEVSKEHKDLIYSYKNTLNIEFTIIELDTNHGLAYALNEGLKYCKYEYIARMDSDDFSITERFEKELNYMKKNKLDVVACLQAEFETLESQIISYKETPEFHSLIKKKLQLRNIISHPSIIIKKTSFNFINGYNIKVGLFEDYDLHIRMINNGFKYGCIQEYLINVRVSPEQRKRRGGVKTMIMNVKLKYNWYLKNYINLSTFLLSSTLFTIFSMTPTSIKPLLYSLVRKKNEKESKNV
jgi:GT2 family glycosyltransferase